jgi:hypothetical protein
MWIGGGVGRAWNLTGVVVGNSSWRGEAGDNGDGASGSIGEDSDYSNVGSGLVGEVGREGDGGEKTNTDMDWVEEQAVKMVKAMMMETCITAGTVRELFLPHRP